MEKDKEIKLEIVEPKETIEDEEYTEEYVEEKKPVTNLFMTPKGKKILATSLLVLAIGTTMFVGGKHVYAVYQNQTPDFSQSAVEVLEASKNDTVLDDIFTSREDNLAEQLDELESTVELSNKIHSLGLDKYIADLQKYEMPETYSIEEVNSLIEGFYDLESNHKVKNDVLSEESRQFVKLCLTLEAYERKINSTLTNDSYETLLDYGTLLVKSKVIDACGFDACEYEQVKIDSTKNGQYVIRFCDTETGKLYELELEKESKLNSNGYVNKVVESMRNWKICCEKADDTGSTYNGERNRAIINGINELKTLTRMVCVITDNGRIAVTTPMTEVKAYTNTIQG